MRFNLPKLFLYLLGAILILNLLQANFTNLIFDEAYYWYYAKTFEWGYFDHPPMVAWMIQVGSFFFDGELGVRFVSVLLSLGIPLLLWAAIDHQKKNDYALHFLVLVFSMPLLHAYGFFTLPDTPLLFFTVLFLLFYKKFLKDPNVLFALGLGLAMAGLMYSKYNAAIIILFVVFSNPKLVFQKTAWLAVGIALLCYTPHFVWLYDHDFISIQYHLTERPNQAYDFFKFTGGFFVNLIGLFGFIFPIVYQSLFKTISKDKFTKALLYLTYGVILFFFASSFQRRVQMQWLIVICIPMVLLTFNYLTAHKPMAKWLLRIGVFNIAILLFARIGLIYEPLFPVTFETHGNKKWIKEVENAATGSPIVFENSYQDAPMYEFYTGKPAISLNNIRYRQNQYSIDGAEASVQGKKVYYLSKYSKKAGRSFPMDYRRHTLYGSFIPNFESFRKLRCLITSEEITFNTEKTQTMQVYNPYKKDIPLEKLRFGIAYMNDYKEVRDVLKMKVSTSDPEVLVLKSNDTVNFTFKLPQTDMKSPTYFKIGISENGLPLGLNGKNIKLK